jgi:RNA polymerase sigma-70 factor (ECF subfamily)
MRVNDRRAASVLSRVAGFGLGLPIARAPRVSAEPVAGPDDERDLVVAAREGDRGAFGALYARHARLVHGVLLARVPRREVDDLVQDVFVQALRRLGALRDPAAFGPWLAAIARNRARDYHRRRDDTDELPDDLPGPGPCPGDAASVLRLIRALPEAYRETLVLRLVGSRPASPRRAGR